MIHTKRIAAVLAVLLAAATIAGCNTKKEEPKEKTETAMGRYVEKTIAMPEAVEEGKEIVFEMLKNAEGMPEIYSGDVKNHKSITQYHLKEDNTWVKENPQWLKNKGMEISGLTCTADGTRYAIVIKYSKDGSKAKVKILKSNNNKDCEELVIKDLDKEVGKTRFPNIPYGIKVLKDNQILLNFDDQISLYQNGKVEYSFKHDRYSYALFKDKLMINNEKTDGVIIIDLNTGKTISEIPCSDSMEWNTFTTDQLGNWYMISELGIQRLVNGGNRWETILDGSMASMSMPSISPESVIMGEDGEFYIMYQGANGKREIKYYVYDKDLPTSRSKTLSVVSLHENNTVRQAITEFQRNNQDIKVDYKTADTQNGGITASDYIKTLNTELLAGKGADIILMDDMPIDSYIEKGVLADLSEVIRPLLDQKEMLDNIIEPYETDGKIYTTPIRIGIPLAYGRKEAVKSVTSMQTLADYAKNKAKLPLLGEDTINKKNLTSFLFQCYSQSFLKETGDFEREGLIQFLKCLKVISDQTKAFSGDQDDLDGMQWDAAQKLYDRKSELGLIRIFGMYDVYEAFAALAIIKGDFQSINQKFVPKGLVGVNNASKNKNQAFAFVKQLYAEEVQINYLGDGFPVNRKALEKFQLEEDDRCCTLDGFEATQPSLEKMQSILNLCKTLTTPVNNDKKLFDMITQESEAYLGGNADVTQTADKIIQRTKTYLAE